MNKKLSSAELAILSLVNEAPRHGYEIEKLIKERGMREWTDIAFSSIYYVLKRLEKADLITPVIFDLEAENNKEKKAYYVTKLGEKLLLEAVKNSIETPAPQTNPMMLGIANWPILEDGQGVVALKKRDRAIRNEIARLTEKAKQPYLPDFVVAMFEHALMQMSAERKWIKKTIKKLELNPKSGNQFSNEIGAHNEGETAMKKEDLKKQLKEFYQPTHKEFSIVDVPKMRFLMINCEGAPDSKAFTDSVAWLYSVTFPVKFIAKKKYGRDFVAPPFEALMWADDMNDFAKGNKDNWKWRLMIAFPDWVTEETFEEAVLKAEKKLGARPDSLRMEYFEEGKSVQIMHIGPYSEEGPTIAKLHNEFLPANGLVAHGAHHEIYLNDPRRVAPEKLRTVIRQPVKEK